MIKDGLVLKPIKILDRFKALSIIPDNLDQIRAREIWNTTNQGSGIVIAVLDSGIQVDHPDLKN
ncbi:peptidase S8, partial (plasmid) [Priestia megaterium]